MGYRGENPSKNTDPKRDYSAARFRLCTALVFFHLGNLIFGSSPAITPEWYYWAAAIPCWLVATVLTLLTFFRKTGGQGEYQ